MRYLGIDYGTKRIGIALSDEGGSFSFAHSVVPNEGKAVFKKIKKICDENNVGRIVLGRSIDYGGKLNPIMEKIEPFKSELEKETGLAAVYEDEFLTSAEARRPLEGEKAKAPVANKKRKYKKKPVDASAAALILKSYLDKSKLEKENKNAKIIK